ncbi:cupin domain-containing protein [Rhodopseudomonas sp. HC1]|uniref:cupin domain-containing protein n=1 Tax=Rhodopseudomonas infernalis TaxID=2897386 RepID=UPI001EE80787|nr:cupin domain-containing protein [Rhodopseudomonas infernalis]MCG6204471.1 cupin domain-containing protein [Rhodopseudomonas infernalis]
MTNKLWIALAVTLAASAAYAQQPTSGIKRTPLQKVEFPDGYVTVSGLAELPAGGRIGRHTHPGIETGYLLEGEALMSIDGQPDKHLKAGDSYSIPAGVVHDAAAHGGGAAKVMAVWVVDKTKPLATPAP